MNPEEKSEDQAEDKRGRKEPASFRYSHERHRNETDHDDQPDEMAGEVSAAIGSKRHNAGFGGHAVTDPISAE